jgi:hypothetical protein
MNPLLMTREMLRLLRLVAFDFRAPSTPWQSDTQPLCSSYLLQ